MTESKILLTNWQHKDIKFKDLIDLGFQMPDYSFTWTNYYPAKNFNFDGV